MYAPQQPLSGPDGSVSIMEPRLQPSNRQAEETEALQGWKQKSMKKKVWLVRDYTRQYGQL